MARARRAAARAAEHGARARGVLALAGMLSFAPRLRGEDRFDYRYEDYAEEGGRIQIRTHGVSGEAGIKPWLSLKANYVHDAISGATPTGAPPLAGERTVAKATIEDRRDAGFLEPSFKLEEHTLSPQIAWSREDDYESIGVSLQHTMDLNEKNTTVAWGISHSFDRVLPNLGESIPGAQRKDSTDVLLGVTQLFGPDTLATANLTLGYADGYLTDPYKRVLFDDFPHTPGQPYTVWPEHRPGHKLREGLFASARHYFEKLHGAIDGSYRFHHDDFGVVAHTVSVEWHQKIGRRVLVTPLFRFHAQAEADFYGTHFPGDPSLAPGTPLPVSYYSADYRLSALHSFTYGLSVSGRIQDHLSVAVSYQRYEMFGTDGRTAADQYPRANVFGGGITLWF